jgi:hypothetical protein
MQAYTFQVALRLWHPTLDPSSVTSVLGITPSRFWSAGSPRVTPKGTVLDGFNQESYWNAQGEWLDSEHADVADEIDKLLAALSANRNFIQDVISSGGRGSVWIYSHGKACYTLEFTPSLQIACAGLGLSLVHDVYPVEQA